jgi:plastocyanin
MNAKALGLSLLLLLAASCGPRMGRAQSPQPPGSVTVELFQFRPPRLEVAAGEAVRWTNQDEVLHTVTAGDPERPMGAFDARLDGRGATFTYTFARPGTYRYFCARHTHMRGEIVVR